MLRTPLVLAAIAATLARTAIGEPLAQAAAHRHQTACQRLKGADRAPAASVRLVKRRNGDGGTDLLGCVLPAGRVRTIASSEHADTANYDYAIDRVAGRIVMLTLSGGNQYAYDMRTVVRDLRGGHSYEIAHMCSPTGGGDCATGGSTVASAAFITNAGRTVAAIVPAPDAQPTATGPVTIAGFDPRGTRRDLDTGSGADLPPSSLALAGNVASWTNAGTPRMADLSAAR
ncbi:MAG TPA: hypothetical protein VGF63_14970 [Solirubrobacteraceae bacterium]|jgi:antitoxin (DNA-binding transcriptional repressor) of toxin-antitoxin stability system